MLSRFITLLLLSGITAGHAYAGDTVDLSEDLDEVAAESDAAMADNEEVKARMAKERAKAERAFAAANRANKAAAAKRQSAIDQMKKTEADILHFENEQKRLIAETKKFEADTVATEKAIVENRQKIEKAKVDVQTLQQLKSEKAGAYLTIATQREKVLEELKQIDLARAEAEKEFQTAKEQEKQALAQHDQLKAEQLKKKARLDAYIASLKERYREMQERKKSHQDELAQMERQTAKLEAQAKAGEAELQSVAAPTNQGSSGSLRVAQDDGAAMTLKKKCRIFDRPTKGSKVLGIQQGGSSVSKKDEGKTWIAFPMADGRLGYIAKTCF